MPRHPVEFTERAEAQFDNLDPVMREEVALRLARLSADPAGQSRPSPSPPYPPGFLISEFQLVHGGNLHHFSILFEY